MRIIVCICFMCLHFYSNAQKDKPVHYMVKSTGKLPALLYGQGDDRLGGTKMGYIDTNVVLHVVDSINELYVVQLSKFHKAYIDKSQTKQDSTITEKPFNLTSSFLVKGDSLYDYVSMRINEHLPYKSWMEIEPSKIIVDIFGVQSNTNWITQLQSVKEIKNVYYQQVEDDVVRVTIDLKHSQHWGYSLAYVGKNLVLKVKRQPAILDLKKMTIAIDAGHGGNNSGTDGVKRKTSEKEYTLLYAKLLEKNLKKLGVKKIIMTRNNDTSFDNKDRILFLQEKNPDFLISLHFNSSENETVSGVSTYYKHIGFRSLSQAIMKRMLELKLNEFGNVGNFNFALNQPTEFPNALVEIAFLSNVEDEKKIIDTKFKQDCSMKLIAAMQDWIKQLHN